MKPERPWRLKWTFIALLLLASIGLTVYLSWIPGPTEQVLVGRWTTTVSGRPPFGGQHQVILELSETRSWRWWVRMEGHRDWKQTISGRWHSYGNVIELQFSAKNAPFRDRIVSIVEGGYRDDLLVLERSHDRLVIHLPDGSDTVWTRVSQNELPQIQDPPSTSQ